VWCYSGVTVVLQWCYSGVTVVLQWCRSGVTVMLQWCYSSADSRKRQCVRKGVPVCVFAFLCVCVCVCVCVTFRVLECDGHGVKRVMVMMYPIFLRQISALWSNRLRGAPCYQT
jgi:hypothetical protein